MSHQHRRRSRSFSDEHETPKLSTNLQRHRSVEDNLQDTPHRPQFISTISIGDDFCAIDNVRLSVEDLGHLRHTPKSYMPSEFKYENPAYEATSEEDVADSSYRYNGQGRHPAFEQTTSTSEDGADKKDISQRSQRQNPDGVKNYSKRVAGLRQPASEIEMATITTAALPASTAARSGDFVSQESSLVTSRRTYLVDDPRILLGASTTVGNRRNQETSTDGPPPTVSAKPVGNRRNQETSTDGPPPTVSAKPQRKRWKFGLPRPRPARLGRGRRACVTGRNRRACVVMVASLVLVALLVAVSLLPTSFIYVEHYEIALRRTKSTWRVHDKTYYPGCYLHGPDMEFYSYNATANTEYFDQIGVYTADKVTFSFSASVWWFIRPEELSDVYNKFGRNFSEVFPSMFLSTMRNTAPQFDTKDYLSKRTLIEATLHQAIYDKMSGNCCPKCCVHRKSQCSSFIQKQCSVCNKGPTCHRGHHIEIRYFFLGEIQIPEEIEGRYLKSLVVEEENEVAEFEQKVALASIENERLVQRILNEAAVIKETSEAEAKKIRAVAGVEGDVIKQKATVTALQGMCAKFNLTEEDHKLSLFYFNSIKGMKNLVGIVPNTGTNKDT